MFDKRLTQLRPESKKYIAGNIILQWLELALNTVMIITVAKTISKGSCRHEDSKRRTAVCEEVHDDNGV